MKDKKTLTTLEREIEWLRRSIEYAEKPDSFVYCDLDAMRESLKDLEGRLIIELNPNEPPLNVKTAI